MKVRMSFVCNSSSSCFLINVKKDDFLDENNNDMLIKLIFKKNLPKSFKVYALDVMREYCSTYDPYEKTEADKNKTIVDIDRSYYEDKISSLLSTNPKDYIREDNVEVMFI